MRFAVLPIGARFRYLGCDYRKVSPLEGIEDTTEARKLIPRSTHVEPIEHRGAEPAKRPSEAVPLESVEAALAVCTEKVERLSRSIHPPLSEDQTFAVLTLMREAHAEAIGQLRRGTGTGRDRKVAGDSGSVDSLTSMTSKTGAERP